MVWISLTESPESISRTTFCSVNAQRLRRNSGANHHKDIVVGPINIGIIDRALRRLIGKARLFDTVDHADDSECLTIRARLRALEKLMAQGDSNAANSGGRNPRRPRKHVRDGANPRP